MRNKLDGFLFPSMIAMNEAISARIEAACDDIENAWLNYKRVHYSLIPCTPDGNRCKDAGHDMEPIFLDKRPTLKDIQEALKDYPEAVEVTLNIDIRGYRTFQDFTDCEDPAFSDTGIDLWRHPNFTGVANV